MITETPRGVPHRAAVSVKREDHRCCIRPRLGRHINQPLTDNAVHLPFAAREAVRSLNLGGTNRPERENKEQAQDFHHQLHFSISYVLRSKLGGRKVTFKAPS